MQMWLLWIQPRNTGKERKMKKNDWKPLLKEMSNVSSVLCYINTSLGLFIFQYSSCFVWVGSWPWQCVSWSPLHSDRMVSQSPLVGLYHQHYIYITKTLTSSYMLAVCTCIRENVFTSYVYILPYKHLYLPLTLTVMVSLSLPIGLVTVHVYVPLSLVVILLME